VSSIAEFLKEFPSFRCWLHVITDIKFHLKKMKPPITCKVEVSRYVGSVYSLLRSESEEDYNRRYLQLTLADDDHLIDEGVLPDDVLHSIDDDLENEIDASDELVTDQNDTGSFAWRKVQL